MEARIARRPIGQHPDQPTVGDRLARQLLHAVPQADAFKGRRRHQIGIVRRKRPRHIHHDRCAVLLEFPSVEAPAGTAMTADASMPREIVRCRGRRVLGEISRRADDRRREARDQRHRNHVAFDRLAQLDRQIETGPEKSPGCSSAITSCFIRGKSRARRPRKGAIGVRMASASAEEERAVASEDDCRPPTRRSRSPGPSGNGRKGFRISAAGRAGYPAISICMIASATTSGSSGFSIRRTCS